MSLVDDMQLMFYGASNFDRDLSSLEDELIKRWRTEAGHNAYVTVVLPRSDYGLPGVDEGFFLALSFGRCWC